MALPQRIEFVRHIFATLTYSRDKSVQQRWYTVSKDFNRYCQSLRRLHPDGFEYLRVVERHKDDYPHIHAIIQFPNASIRVENSRYFTKSLYAKWKSTWTHGHSDYQKPKHSGHGTLMYIMKYLIKNTTAKTIWKKCFDQRILKSVPTVEDATTPISSKPSSIIKLPVRVHGVKLATWSRNFDFTPFQTSYCCLESPFGSGRGTAEGRGRGLGGHT